MNMFFPDTPARRVIRIIRIIRIIRSYGLALRHPAAPARHRSLPACPASEPAACQARAKVGIFPRKKIPVLPWGEDCSTSFFLANGCEAPAARHRSPAAPARHSLQPAKPAPAPKVCQRCCPRSIADRVFFHHSHALPSILAWAQDCHTQSWRGHRIASPNPAVATGLPLQSCCGNRIASPNPALTTGMPRCITSSSGLELFFPERRLVMESAPL